MRLTLQFAGQAWAQEGEQAGHDTGIAGEEQTEVPAAGGHDAAAGEAHTETGAGHGEGETFPPFDPTHFSSQLLWLTITFALLYVLMSRIVIPRIGGILEARSDRISQDLDEAQRLKDESDAAYAAYEHELAEARNRAHKIAQDARDKAKAEADAEREKVEADLAERLEESERQIAAIKKEAMAQVDEIARSTTDSIIRQLLGKDATDKEIAAAVDNATKGDA